LVLGKFFFWLVEAVLVLEIIWAGFVRVVIARKWNFLLHRFWIIALIWDKLGKLG